MKYGKQVSINTIRVSLGGTKAAEEELKKEGYYLVDNKWTWRYKDSAPSIYQERKEANSLTPSNQKTLIITSYLIGSSVNKTIWHSLNKLVDLLEAELVVIAHRYKNPSILEDNIKDSKEGYVDPLVLPYLCWKDFNRFNHDILGSIQVNYTALNPLQQIKKFVTKHTIIGHSLQSLLVKPESGFNMPKVCWSTGTISNIDEASNLKSKQAQFHYKYGCIVLTTSGESRNVHFCKDGFFSDLDVKYSPGSNMWKSGNSTSMIWGDYHHGQTCPEAKEWALDIARKIKPTNLYLHDFIDGATVNPHASKSERSLLWDGCLARELTSAAAELRELKSSLPYTILKLVKSNHNDMISRYFKNTRVSEMPLSHTKILQKWIECGFSPELLLKELSGLAGLDVVDDYTQDLRTKLQLNSHGDKGVNGSRSSHSQLFTNGFIGVVGHTHTPFILGGANGVGTLSKLKLGYNDYGASTWLNSIAITNHRDKVQHLIKFN
jgi:hypothetical protein